MADYPMLIPPILAASIIAALFIATEMGFRLGRRAVKNREAPGGGIVGAIQGATLGLLGLLLGFSFAGAAGRFMERQDLILTEANAIGTAYLRAELLDELHADALRSTLSEYVAHRIDASRTLHHGLSAEAAAAIDVFHQRMWAAARDGASARPATIMAVLPPVNDVIDLHSTRVAAGNKHLPSLVLWLLLMCSVLAVGVIGYGCGLSGRRCLPITGSLAILIAATLWTTIDLDHPRMGLIRLSDAPLRTLRLE